MLSRRELFTAGVAGGLSASTDVTGLPSVEQQLADRAGQTEIKKAIDNVESVLRSTMLTNSLSHGVVGKVRGAMEQFFRPNGKFPDFIDIGYNVFVDLYDWHVKNRQQLMVTRAPDGRYWMQFMFTTLILRAEVDPNSVGLPYDKA